VREEWILVKLEAGEEWILVEWLEVGEEWIVVVEDENLDAGRFLW
jgi:hypothetical protein